MKKTIRYLLMTLLAASAANAFAFTFQPMFVRLDATGPGNVQTFEVRNEGDESLPVRFSVLPRTVGPDGVEGNEDASALFTVYPPRLVVEPRSTAAVKLQWNGPAGLATERAFRLIAESVALDSGKPATSGIRVMVRYIASIYVGEADFSPELVSSVKGATGPKGEKGFNVEIVNRGTRHVVAESAILSIKGAKDGVLALGSEDLGALSDANYLPGYPRRLFIPRVEAIAGTTYDAQIDYDAVY